MTLVLDASITLSWAFADEAGSLGDSVLARLAEEEGSAPAIWPFEVANALLVAHRRGRISHAESQRFLGLLESLGVEVDRESLPRAFAATLELARQYGLSAYDASYLELALRAGRPLATADEGLREAARASGVALVA